MKKEGQFTVKKSEKIPGFYYILDDQGNMICQVQPWSNNDKVAHLLGAAPDLLKALKILFDAISKDSKNYPYFWSDIPKDMMIENVDKLCDAMIFAESTIKKAEGKDT